MLVEHVMRYRDPLATPILVATLTLSGRFNLYRRRPIGSGHIPAKDEMENHTLPVVPFYPTFC